jgi:hypothetical protein
MEPLTRNGGMIGKNVSYDATDSYVLDSVTGLLTPQFVGAYTESGAGTTSDINIPLNNLSGGLDTVPSIGDIIVIYWTIGSDATPSFNVVDYTLVDDLVARDSYDTHLFVAYKFYAGETTITITSGSQSTANGWTMCLHVWRNIDETTPFDVTPTESVAISTAIPNPPSIRPVTTGSIILVGASSCHSRSTQTFSAPYLSGFVTSGSSDSEDTTGGLGYVNWTGGTYYPPAFGFSGGDSSLYSAVAITSALRPATGTTDILGNKKSSGVWDTQAAYLTKI